ncbi:nucleotide-binding protein [Candidatus Alkanophaga liquidiphilum]|nr:Nitrogenase ATPase subunit NifH/coenzyme F430 biosynthesis subunit CfbC [Candidatus Alkanophaga liquidiphilum]RLG36823.1 MAG: nitrogenase iron protein [Candidatus Alkanophagales archaeon]
MKQVAFYGKGGVGKSTVATNVAAALSEAGKRVLVVGCDPKHDCTANLRHGKEIPTVLDVLRAKGMEKRSIEEIVASRGIRLSDVVFKGYNGVFCVEAGGPKPGYGCAGRGIIVAIDLLKKLDVFGELKPDIVIYDVLGDVVCGGFAMPLRLGLADEVCVVTSADYLAIYAANNICKGVCEFAARGGSPLGGIIYNARGPLDAPDIVERFAAAIGSHILCEIPNNKLFAEAEVEGKTVVEMFPASEIAATFRRLAERLLGNEKRAVPTPLSEERLSELRAEVRLRMRRRLKTEDKR